MNSFSTNNKDHDRLIQLSTNIGRLYRWGSTHERFSEMVDLDEPVSEISDTIELDEYQQQELDEIANLNKNFDIFGTDLDTIYESVIVYENNQINKQKFYSGMHLHNLQNYSDELWKVISSTKPMITKDLFRNLFRSSRVSSLLKIPTAHTGYPISLYYLSYTKENAISLVSSSDYRKVLYELFNALQKDEENYADDYRYLHIDSVNDEIVQLLGAVLNLDVDTILSIVPNTTQMEFTQFDNYTYFTLPWLMIKESDDEAHQPQLTKTILHVLIFKHRNLVISLKDATLYSTESNVPFQDPFNLFPVFKTFRRFHTRYHSNIASLLYLMDLHVDRISRIVTHIVTELHQIEDRIILNDVKKKLSIRRKQEIQMDYVLASHTMLDRMKGTYKKLSESLLVLRETVETMQNRYFNDFRKSEYSYLVRDIGDHLKSVNWAIDEGEKLYNSISEKYDLSADRRYNNLIYIVTVFQTIFLPLQTITAIYGMNFDVMPELRYHYSYYIFWVVCIVVGITIAVLLLR